MLDRVQLHQLERLLDAEKCRQCTLQRMQQTKFAKVSHQCQRKTPLSQDILKYSTFPDLRNIGRKATLLHVTMACPVYQWKVQDLKKGRVVYG